MENGEIAIRSTADRDYHVARARAELDLAYRAPRSRAASAHLRLCSMHMARARKLREETSERQPELDWIDHCLPLHEKCLAGAV